MKQKIFRSFFVGTGTTTLLVFVSFNSIAQKSNLSLEKLGLKNLQPQLSYIPAKSFKSLEHTGSDSVSTYQPRISSVQGFFISKTEVTNREYREFVFYVRDSMAHALLKHFNNVNNLDWKQKIDWKDDRLMEMLLSSEENVSGRKEIDPAKITYNIDFFGKKDCISIYPDTLVWIRDFSYSNNEPMVKNYFSQSLFDQYPVVGISLKQAMAFCQWKKTQLKEMLKGKDAEKTELMVTIPTNAEWESAAFDGKDSVNVLTGNKGYSCNFGNISTWSGVMKKNFKDDGYYYTSPVKNYPAGPFGLYDMKGNVAEWTLTCREEIMNAEVQPEKVKTSFVVKGGGWNSTPFYLQAGVCQFFRVDEGHSFIGFRYVVHVFKK